MLTPDLVLARRREGELVVQRLSPAQRTCAQQLAEAYLAIVRDGVGRTRDELDELLDAVQVKASEQRLAEGLRKLVEDRCEFGAPVELDAVELRRELFRRAAAGRRALDGEARFERSTLLQQVADERSLSVEALELALYGDLRGAQALRGVGELATLSPARLVAAYELGQSQAVLLRAVKVVATVFCSSAGAYRALFHRLRFLRLLYTIHPVRPRDDPDAPPDPRALRLRTGYRVELDGPFSLFDSVTKYGLQLALALPAVRRCDQWHIEAELRWGKGRERLMFREAGAAVAEPDDDMLPPAHLSDEVQGLLNGVRAAGGSWKVAAARALLELPGVGLCVPDLVFTHRPTGEKVYLEVLGFWSRQAVWRRIELVQRGLSTKVLFAVSERLRVSEAALDKTLPSALYVFKHALSPRAVLERLDGLLG
jgi:hypothetical protein